MNRPDSDQHFVLDVVRRADRLSRAQRVARVLARTAPLAGGLLFLTAVAGYFAAWPPGVTIGVGLVSAGMLAALVALTVRHRPPADVTAARIDADADLRGELRSAHWFAGIDSQDPWVLFHLERAAERVRAVIWSEVYPPVRARRAWAATLVLTTAAFVLPLGLVIRHVVASTSSEDSVVLGLDGPISPALRDEVMAVLEAARQNGVPLDEVMAAVSQVVGVKSSDPRLREQISELLKQGKFSAASGQAIETTTEMNGAKDAQADQNSRQDSKPLPDELRRALQQLAAGVARESERANAMAEDASQEGLEQASGDTTAADGSPQGASSPGGELPDDMGTGQTAAESASARSERGGAAAGEMMMMDSEDGFAGGTPGLGYGGVKGPSLVGDPKQIVAALKLELLEANTNIDGADIRTEEARKTEQGRSAIAYSKTAGLATFARALGDVPPSVPEARRPLVARYFGRTASPADSGATRPQPASPR